MPIKVDNVRTKGIHVKLDRQTHANFKARLAHHGLSMQEAFEEFARLLGSGSLAANRMMDSLIRTQIRRELAEVGTVPLKRERRSRLCELDPETLYDLINKEQEEADDSLHGEQNEAA